jgi:hypothetical protein
VHGRISNLKLSGQETVSPSEKPGLKGLNPEGSVIAVPSLQFMTADFPSCTRERAIAETPALDSTLQRKRSSAVSRLLEIEITRS